MAFNFCTLPRDPTQDRRTRLFMDLVGGILNSMIESGVIVQTGPGSFELPSAGGDTEQEVIAAQVLSRRAHYGMWGG